MSSLVAVACRWVAWKAPVSFGLGPLENRDAGVLAILSSLCPSEVWRSSLHFDPLVVTTEQATLTDLRSPYRWPD
jgi:hypothetical protein